MRRRECRSVRRVLADDLEVESAGDARGARRQERQQPIVKTAAVAQAMSFAIEREAGDDDEIDRVPGYRRAMGERLGDALRAGADIALRIGDRAELEHPRRVVDARSRDVLPASNAARTRARVSHSLRKGSVTSTVFAPEKSARASIRPTIDADAATLAAAGMASRSARTLWRIARFAARKAFAGRMHMGRRRHVADVNAWRTASRSWPAGTARRRIRPRAPTGGWPYNRTLTSRRPHEPQSPDLSRSAHRGRAADARADWRRAGPRPHRGRSDAQSRFDVPVSARQLLLLYVGLSRSPTRSSPSSPTPRATGTCCSAAKRTRSGRSGTAFATDLTPRGRFSASTRRIRLRSSTECCRISRPTDPRCTRRSVVRGMGSQDLRPPERSEEAGSHGGCGAGGDRRRAAGDRCAAAREGRARDRPHASRGDHFRLRAQEGDGSYARRLARIPGRSGARPRVPAERRAGGRLPVDRRGRAQRVRAALPREQPPAAGRRAPADRRRLRVSRLRVRHHAHLSGERPLHGPQKAIYEVVLAAQQACLDAVRPGGLPRLPQDRGAVLAQGSSISGFAEARSTRCSRRQPTSASTCTAPATGSAWTCTTPAPTRPRASRGSSRPAWC